MQSTAKRSLLLALAVVAFSLFSLTRTTSAQVSTQTVTQTVTTTTAPDTSKSNNSDSGSSGCCG